MNPDIITFTRDLVACIANLSQAQKAELTTFQHPLQKCSAACAKILDPSFELRRQTHTASGYWALQIHLETDPWVQATLMVWQNQDTQDSVPTTETLDQVQRAKEATAALWHPTTYSQEQSHALIIWQAAQTVHAHHQELLKSQQKADCERNPHRRLMMQTGIRDFAHQLACARRRFTQVCKAWEGQAQAALIGRLIANLPGLNQDLRAIIGAYWKAIQALTPAICTALSSTSKR